jgi:hypothetical protein
MDEANPTADDWARRARAFVSSCRWRFGRSIPADPHWYSLPDDTPHASEREWFIALIREYGRRGEFVAQDPGAQGASGSRWVYLTVDDHRYWVSRVWTAPEGDNRPMLNRARVGEDPQQRLEM